MFKQVAALIKLQPKQKNRANIKIAITTLKHISKLISGIMLAFGMNFCFSCKNHDQKLEPKRHIENPKTNTSTL